MTIKDYLIKSGWKNKGEEWESPFTKKLYSFEDAINVEADLKGAEYINRKLNEIEKPHSAGYISELPEPEDDWRMIGED